MMFAYESIVVAVEAAEMAKGFISMSDSHLAKDLESEENSAFDTGLSSRDSPRSPSEALGGHTPDGPSHAHLQSSALCLHLDSGMKRSCK